MDDKHSDSDQDKRALVEQNVSLPERRGPWLCRNREQVYDNDWIAVSHEEVTTPGGTEGIYGLIHFKHTAVGIVALDDKNNITLVRQFRYALNQNSWEIPEGGSHRGEGLEQCARRELQEEAGLGADCWQQVLSLHTSNSVTDEYAVIFLATGLSRLEQSLDVTEEDLEVTSVALGVALEMIDRGEITDAMSVAGIFRVARGVGI